jgi:hypothetical protein
VEAGLPGAIVLHASKSIQGLPITSFLLQQQKKRKKQFIYLFNFLYQGVAQSAPLPNKQLNV